MYGYELPSTPTAAFIEGMEAALASYTISRESNPYRTSGGPADKEWDRGYMAATEHVYILRALQERGMM